MAIPPSSGLSSRRLADNTIAILDSPGASSDDNTFGQLQLVAGTADVYRASSIELRIAARATALFAVIPQVTPLPTDPIPVDRDFEVRGYVQVRLPAVDSLDGEPEDGTLQPQSPRPVRVLLTPQNRAAFYVFPNANSFAGGELRNQIQAGLPTASGAALVEIEPEGAAVPA